jgi:hypothetical protein
VTDADIVYLKPFDDLFAKLLDGRHMLLAREFPDDVVRLNIGQMVIRPSPEVADFFRHMAADLRDGQTQARYRRDQAANQNYINEGLRSSGLNYATLPETFANTGILKHLGEPEEVDLYSYHATETHPGRGTTSLDKKHLRLLEVVSRSGIDLEDR